MSMDNDIQLRVACVQFSPLWESPEKNLKYLTTLLQSIDDIDLVILPEMFNTGFALNHNNSRQSATATITWMHKLATEKQALICGSIKLADNGKIFNRFVAISPRGMIANYDKVHLFSQEKNLFSAGRTRVVFNWKGFRILPQICYDLRFPAFSRNNDDYDLIMYLASWPKPRIHHWDNLLKARAIENLSYVIGVNRVGQDGNDWQYVGHSQIITPMGDVHASVGQQNDAIIVSTIDLEAVIKTRQNLPYLQDRDEIHIAQASHNKARKPLE